MFDLDGSSNQQLCEDNTFIVIGVVLAVVVVLIGSVFNFIYWRRNTGINLNSLLYILARLSNWILFRSGNIFFINIEFKHRNPVDALLFPLTQEY